MVLDEKTYYEPIKKKLEERFRSMSREFYLEITASKSFSNKLKRKISEKRNMIFSFLKEAAPDITGYVETDTLEQLFSWEEEYYFVVAEVKRTTIKLDDIYQVRKYSELFDARLTLLVTLEEIPEEIKRLSKVVKQLLSQPDGEKIIIAQFDPHRNDFREWYPKNPFK